MPENTITRPDDVGAADPRDQQPHDRNALDEMVDRNRLDAMLAKYGAATLVEWIAEMARAPMSPRS
jgi:hypothetical protein